MRSPSFSARAAAPSAGTVTAADRTRRNLSEAGLVRWRVAIGATNSFTVAKSFHRLRTLLVSGIISNRNQIP